MLVLNRVGNNNGDSNMIVMLGSRGILAFRLQGPNESRLEQSPNAPARTLATARISHAQRSSRSAPLAGATIIVRAPEGMSILRDGETRGLGRLKDVIVMVES